MTHPDDDAFMRAIDADPHDVGLVYQVLLQWCDYLQETGMELEAKGIRWAVKRGKMPMMRVSIFWDWWPLALQRNTSLRLKPKSSRISHRLMTRCSLGEDDTPAKYHSCSAAWADLGRAYAKMVRERQAKEDQRFTDHLKFAAATVATWPEWKQNVLGGLP